MRKSSNATNNQLRRDQFDLFTEVVLKMDTKRDLVLFFNGFLTESERAIVEQRLDIMRMLAAGKGYGDILQTLGVSTSTIIRAAKSLKRSNRKVRQALINWTPLSIKRETVSQPSSGELGNFFQATKPGAIRRVHKFKKP